jgi:hypothetical protein
MALTVNDLCVSPDHYLHSFDGDALVFAPMDRAAYHRSIFLDGRISPAANGVMRLPFAALAHHMPKPTATSWIFHVAHCGSTLLARALDRLDGNLVLREPLALRQIALAPDEHRLAVVAAMLGRRYLAELPTVVKANVPVNFLLPRLALLDPEARAIFLYLPLRQYLFAILRSVSHRDWLRRVTGQLAAHLDEEAPRNDAERAAALWLAQMGAFADAPLSGARALDAELLFVEPQRVLAAAAAHLGVALDGATVESIVTGSLFATYSKDPAVPFDNAARLARRMALEATLAGELAVAEAWAVRKGAMDILDAVPSLI